MKLLFTLLLSAVPADASFYPVGKAGAKTSYSKKDVCEATESFTCWDIRGMDLRYMVPGTEDVDDPDRPIYEAESAITACTDQDSCFALLSETYCVDNGLTEDHYQLIAEDFSRVYCTRLLGFEQKTVPALVINQTLKDQADADDAAEAADKAAREVKQGTRNNEIDACARNENLQGSQIGDCIRALAKELAKLRLEESEL